MIVKAVRNLGSAGNAKFYSRLHDAMIRVFAESGNVIETHEHKGEFKEWTAGPKTEASITLTSEFEDASY